MTWWCYWSDCRCSLNSFNDSASTLHWESIPDRDGSWKAGVTEGLRERTEYVPQNIIFLWKWENYSKSQWRGRKPAIILSYSVLPPEIVMHDAYIGGRSENNIKCVAVHNDLGRKNRTTRYNCRFSAASLALRVIFVRRKRPSICVVHDDLGWIVEEPSKSWLQSIRIRRHSLSILTE